MKTLEFTHDLKEIVDRMRVVELLNMLGKWLVLPTPQQPQVQQPMQNISEQEKNQFSDSVFGSYAGYVSLMTLEGPRKILEGLDAKDFYEPNKLRVLVTSISTFTNVGQVRTLGEAHAFYEKLRSLQKLELTCRRLLESEKLGAVEPNEEILQLELADYDGKGIEPERLRLLVTTVRELHTNLSRLFGVKGDILRFKYFDSGSSVLLGILCGKDTAKTISDLLMAWWDKLKFADFDTLDKKIDAVERAVAMSEKMKAAVEKGAVNEEEGKILTHRIFQEVDVLMGIGATPPLKAEVTLDQRALILAKRDVKLLQSGEESQSENKGDDQKPVA